MKATSTIVRILFLVVAFFSYTKTMQAAQWQFSCNSYCNGYLRINECEFWDNDAGYSYDTCTEADTFFEGLCQYMASPYYGFGGVTSCYENSGNPTGTFYCSYEDFSECPGP